MNAGTEHQLGEHCVRRGAEAPGVMELRLGDLRIAYTRAGSRPSASPCSIAAWRTAARGAGSWTASRGRVHGAGLGRTRLRPVLSDVPQSWRMPEYADALASWLGAAENRNAHTSSASLGGALWRGAVPAASTECRSLILASAYAGWTSRPPPQKRLQRAFEGVLRCRRPAHSRRCSEAFPVAWSRPQPRPGLLEELTVMWADNTDSRKPGGYRAMAHSMAEADLQGSTSCPGVQGPRSCWYGELDSVDRR